MPAPAATRNDSSARSLCISNVGPSSVTCASFTNFSHLADLCRTLAIGVEHDRQIRRRNLVERRAQYSTFANGSRPEIEIE